MNMKFVLLSFLTLALAGSAFAQGTKMTTIKVFFSNEILNPNINDCNKVYPLTRRILKTSAIAKAALEEMFKGVSKQEMADGYRGIPSVESNGVFKSINVKNGAAYVNFTNRLTEQMGTATTSCGGGQYFGMIEKTLTQFPTIKKVYYAVEGDTNEFYEWAQVGECPYGRHCRKSNFR